MGFAIISSLARHRRPHIRFLFIGSRLCSTLLSGPASRRVLFHPCASRSPLLSNLVLDELDRELERRGHYFVRYADDCNIYVSSERAGQRVMESVTRFITHQLHEGKSDEERRGPTWTKEVSRIQLHR
jgi:hypothetical protein